MSMGKTLFLNRLLGRPVFKNSDCEVAMRNMDDIALRVRRQEVVEDDFQIELSVIDAPQIGFGVRKDLGNRAITSYVEDCLHSFLCKELSMERSQPIAGACKEDDRVHVLSTVDIHSLKALSSMTNVIIAVGKSDLLTSDECDILLQTAWDQCRSNGICLFGLADEGAKIFPLTKNVQKKAVRCGSNLENCLIRQFYPHLIERLECHFYEAFRADKLH